MGELGLRDSVEAIVEKHREAIDGSFSPSHCEVIEAMIREIVMALKAGHKILICGNGGSAADSQHIAAEFVVRFRKNRKSLPAIALTTDTSIMTAAANDLSYHEIFARQIQALGTGGDVLIALSTSGNSENVLAAARQARELGLRVLAFSDAKGGKLKAHADLCYLAQAEETSHVQEVHITVLHLVTELVENIFFGT